MTATPPRADLRTLAAEAIRTKTWVKYTAGDGHSSIGQAEPEDVADAVLAAVLPDHRRMVLTEAAEERQKAAELTGWFLSNDDLRDCERAAYERGRAAAFTDAAEAIETEAADLGRNGHTAREEAYLAAVALIQEIAAAAPSAGLSATVPAQSAPAVPEEADGQRAGGEVRCTCDDFGDGECVVHDALTYAEMEAERDRLAGEVYEAQEAIRRLTEERDYLARTVTWIVEGPTAERDRALLAHAEEFERRMAAAADRDRLAAQVAHCQRVVEAAKAWRAMRTGTPTQPKPESFALIEAVDALAGIGQGDD